MPPSGFNKKAVAGLLTFLDQCYGDIQAEVRSGKHPDEKTALAHERGLIGRALEKLHVNDAGDLEERP